MADPATVGVNVRRLRRWRGKDQATLAGLVGRSQAWMSKVEAGKARLDRLADIEALADALQVHPGDITGEAHRTAGSRTHQVDALVPAIRVALIDAVPDIPPASLPELRRRVGAASAVMWRDGDLVELAAALPDLIGNVRLATVSAASERDRREALELLAVIGSVAFPMLKNCGWTDLAIVAANLSTSAAEELGEPLWRAYAEFRRSHALIPSGAPVRAVEISQKAVDALEPHMGTADMAAQRMYGMAHLTTALWAARAGASDTAADHLNAASRIATRIGDGEWVDITFGPAQVAIHRVGIAARLGDGDRAPELAAQVNLDAVPSSVHRAMLSANVANGLAHVRGRADEAVGALRRAETLSPQRMRSSVQVRSQVMDLLGQRMRPSSLRELRGLAFRTGLDT